MAPGVLVWFAFRDRSVDLFVIEAGSAMLFLLVLARILELVRKVEGAGGRGDVARHR